MLFIKKIFFLIIYSLNLALCLHLHYILFLYIKMNISDLYIYKVKFAIVVEGDQKASFSIATTPRCRGGRYSFPLIAPLYPRYVPSIAGC